ncbi:MAG: YggS family pyridoxal phosphate-dependent enzyme [Acidobacteriaceae bacterium]|nr:YggS family pyridoxal phosphate-dependent enzyme [Acidobacteriaceae bacterium]MBV9780654.1 YggS family pyridoxal phosphate-dependent enzyme [Acidobacteriaceae bacterium]
MQAVERRIQSAAERARRTRSDITLVAVTKKFSAEAIRNAYQAGLRDFGENYVQEFAQKQPELRDTSEARFHLIGHLQSNKARLASELFHVIETADSAKLLARLDAAAADLKTSPRVLIEVKLSDEKDKTGALPEELPQLLDAARECTRISVSGLMTMPPWSTDPEQSRSYFQELARLARQNGLTELSMGMSGDFEVAIEEGATIIRVGTALFGPRPKPHKPPLPLAS